MKGAEEQLLAAKLELGASEAVIPELQRLAQVRISERRRRSINRATVERYRQWLEQGREAPPVRLAPHGDVYVVRDGRHRVAAALAAGHTVVEAVLQWIAEMLGLLRRILSISGRTWG